MHLPCPHCHRTLQLPDHLAGQTLRCSACQATFLVPADRPSPPPAEPEEPTPPPANSPFSFEEPAAPAGNSAAGGSESHAGARRRMRVAGTFLLYGLGCAAL